MLVDWLVLGSIGILAVALVAILILRILHRSFQMIWLVAFVGTALAWLLIVLARLGIPHEIHLDIRQLNELADPSFFSISPTLVLDHISWTFALALVSLGLSVIMTAVSRLDDGDWRSWFIEVSLTILGILAVLAGNPISVILVWTALDFVEFITWIIQVPINAIRNDFFITLATRISGTVVLIGITTYSYSKSILFTFEDISQLLSPYLILAAVLRLGVVPFQPQISAGKSMNIGVSTLLRLTSLGASLVLIVRVTSVGIPVNWLLPLTLFVLTFFLYSSIRWLVSNDETDGRPFWVLSVASISILAALLSQPIAGLVLGVTGLLIGGLLFLYNVRNRSLLILLVLAIFSLSILPFSSTWQAVSLINAYWQQFPLGGALLAIIIILVGYSLLLSGYIRHGLRIDPNEKSPERWIWLLYVPGLALLVLTEFALSWIYLPEIRNLNIMGWLTGVIICGIIASLFVLEKKRQYLQNLEFLLGKFQTNILRKIFSFRVLVSIVRWLYKIFGNLIGLFNLVFEGEGGLLWSYLFLIMLISLAFQLGLVP